MKNNFQIELLFHIFLKDMEFILVYTNNIFYISVSDSILIQKIHKDPTFFSWWHNGVTLEIDIPIYLQTPFWIRSTYHAYHN